MSDKNSQHRRSVETLGLSGNDDELIIAKIDRLIHNRTHSQPYSGNLLIRIKWLTELSKSTRLEKQHDK